MTTERNIRVQKRYDELRREGRHGHYETMFRVVNEEVDAALADARKRVGELEKALKPFANAASLYTTSPDEYKIGFRISAIDLRNATRALAKETE